MSLLPKFREQLLSEEDRILNDLPVGDLINLFQNGKAGIYVDKGMAISLSAAGSPTSLVATIFSLAFSALLLAILPLLIFASWQLAGLSTVAAIVCYKIAKHNNTEDLRMRALKDPDLLTSLMSKGIIWFQKSKS